MILQLFFSFSLLLSSTTFCDEQKKEDSKQIENAEQINETQIPEKKSHPITITNDIKPEMLAYKHWTGTYKPTEFKLTVNGTEVKAGEKYEVSSDQTLEIHYQYSFMNGKRTGEKTVTYELQKDVQNAAITFSWDNESRIIVDNAQPVKSTHITG